MSATSTPEAEDAHSKASTPESNVETSPGFNSINHRRRSSTHILPDRRMTGYPSPTSTRKQSPVPSPAPSSQLDEPRTQSTNKRSADPATRPLRAPVKYPAYEKEQLIGSIRLGEAERRELATKLVEFNVRSGSSSDQVDGEGSHINASALSIPYSGKGLKQTSWARTGRKSLEVLQYTFTLPTDGRSFTVMWDYQIGLVRIRPFFAAVPQHEKKTRPQAALDQNPGLADLTYHLTGGSIRAQGYWMPFACARALCATFCYEIRWALTPIFGAAFLRDCVPRFTDYAIERQIIVNAAREADTWIQNVPGLLQGDDASQDCGGNERHEERNERSSCDASEKSTATTSAPQSRPKPTRTVSAMATLVHQEPVSTPESLAGPCRQDEPRRRSWGASARKRSASSDGRISNKKRRLSADDANVTAARTLLDLAKE